MGNRSASKVADGGVDELKNSSETRVPLEIRCMIAEESKEIFSRESRGKSETWGMGK